MNIDQLPLDEKAVPVSLDAARRLILSLQGLGGQPHLAQSLDDLQVLISKMGFVQVDSIQWVERAHHMILHARNQTYRCKNLHLLAEKRRSVFENWTHDASFIPVEFFPWWQHRFVRREAMLQQKFDQWQGVGFLKHTDVLLERIARDGALRSRDLEKPKRDKPQEMWQWDDGKAALEFLWRTGKLAISGRDGFQKIYDLTERVIPDEYRIDIQTSNAHSHDAFVDWACRSALERLGFGSAKDIAHFWELLSLDEVKGWIARQEAGQLVSLDVATVEKGKVRQVLALPNVLDLLGTTPPPPARLRILSPFDPVIRDRNRLQWLFGFDYRIEIYVPEHKRKFGYYVFPMMEGSKLVGRIDMRADRKADSLTVRRFWLEKGIRWNPGRRSKLEAELVRQARLSGVRDVVWLEDNPTAMPD